MRFLLFIFLLIEAPLHDIQVAYFKIYENQKNIIVDITFEKDDIVGIFNKDVSKISDEDLIKYVKKHFSIKVDQIKQEMDLGDVSYKSKHITMKGKIASRTTSANSIEVYNSCLLDIEDHSNIIKIRLNDQERDFLMNTKRTSIKLNY